MSSFLPPLGIISSYDVFIFDIDGTLRNGTEPIAGVTQAILELIKDESKHIFFYTNAGYCDRNKFCWASI